MASHERETMGSSEFHSGYVDNFSEENNIMSPKGSLSESNITSSGWSTYSSPSNYSSPFGSEIGSTETEREDDDFISELNQLTRRMAEYTFQDDDEEFQKPTALAPLGTASDNSDKGSGLSSEDWSIGYSSSVYVCDRSLMMGTPEKSDSDPGLANNVGYQICPDKVFSDEHMRPLQVYDLKNQPQITKQDTKERVKASENNKGHQNMQKKEGKARRNGKRKMLNPPPPPPPPAAITPQTGSGMRVVFLGGPSNTRPESCGTGVFLPSGAYCAAEPAKKKSGCSTVLIPARVLQTLQQHFNHVGGQSQSISCSGSPIQPWQNEVLSRINGLLQQQKEQVEFQTRPPTTNHEEEEEEEVVQLPQEWTY